MAITGDITWGAIVGGYGRIGLEITGISATNTNYTFTVNIWFWSKYSVDDSSNSLYYNNLVSTGEATYKDPLKQPGRILTTVASGEGWSTSNQKLLATYTYTYSKTKDIQTRYLYAKLTDVDRVGGTMYVSRTWNVLMLNYYSVIYNANGGSGAPSSQVKWYGENLTLSTSIPTRSGYIFKGWATSASATSAAYSAGGTYSANAAVTLYAVWQARTYTVTYNANGGSGAPASQTKTHAVTLYLSSTKPTRTGYTFLGWSVSSSATTAQYAAGGAYGVNSNLTLYAVWKSAYKNPAIFNLKAERCDSGGTLKEDGQYAKITFEWQTTFDVTSISVTWASASSAAASATIAGSGKSGNVSAVVGNNALTPDNSYDVTVTVKDSGGNVSAYVTLPGMSFPVDVLAGGKGVSFGKPAELGATESLGGAGVVDFGFDAKFNEPVYGKALGMDRLPAIPENSDLNNYKEPGCYAIYSNAVAQTISNIPGTPRAGRLEVWSATGEGVRLEQWSYLRQRFIPYNKENPVYEREVTRGENNVWTYSSWWRSSLSPSVSQKIYDKAGITVAFTDNITLGKVNTYTQIPFNREVLSRNQYLSLSSGGVLINGDLGIVRISCQVLVESGNTAGLRHMRIQRVQRSSSGGTSTASLAWTHLQAAASSKVLLSFTPIIATVQNGDIIKIVFYTPDATDTNIAGSSANGWQSYLTIEEI